MSDAPTGDPIAHPTRAPRSAVAVVGAGAVAVVLVAAVAGGLHLREQRQQEGAVDAAQRLSQGVQRFEGLSANHTDAPVDYPQTPPVGGDHAAVWLNCGAYDRPVPEPQAVHSLEHGAVWITYRPGLPAGQVAQLRRFTEQTGYAIVSPYPGLPAPVVASAWGRQLKVEDPSDERLTAFVRTFAQGPQTPEPGAPCTGGAGGAATPPGSV